MFSPFWMASVANVCRESCQRLCSNSKAFKAGNQYRLQTIVSSSGLDQSNMSAESITLRPSAFQRPVRLQLKLFSRLLQMPTPSGPAALPPNAQVCPDNHSAIGTSVTSCAFAEQVRLAYAASGPPSPTPRDIDAYSPVTGQYYTMTCSANGGLVTSSGGDDALVHVYREVCLGRPGRRARWASAP
jgi:hypothetical protein